MKKERRILTNIIYAFAAQGISLLLSILTSLILPKFFDKINYGYWSLFLFYTGYTGFFHFGLNDGVYLKIGGTEYEDMDKRLLGSQFWFGAFFQCIIGLGIALWAVLVGENIDTWFVFIMTAVYLLLFNLTMYLGCIFQAANETKLYSLSVMIDKVFFMISIVALFLIKNADYKVYVSLYMFAKLIAMAYCIYKGKEIVFCKMLPVKTVLSESFDSMRIGIKLTIANIAGNLILGVGRFFIERCWGIEDFGEVSFSFTLTNFFLLFVSQISMVLFPALRQIDGSKQKNLFFTANNVLNIILPAVFICFIPAKEILRLWLPQYSASLTYMAVLLPLCIFDGKMNLVCATYFKVLRKEKFLLVVNLISMSISALLCIWGAYGLKSIDWIIVFMVISVGIRYFISQSYLESIFAEGNKSIFHRMYMPEELILTVVCAFSCFKLSSLYALIICIFAYLVYLLLNKKSVLFVIDLLKRDRCKYYNLE